MPNAIYELPYDGAKEMLLVDNVDNKDFLTRLFVAMYDELPAQKRRSHKIGIYGGKLFMKKFRTVASVIIMVIAGIVGFFIGAFLNEPMAGTILFSMIAGIACIVYAIDNHEE